MNATFTFYADPGHAWLAVTSEQLKEVNLSPSKISDCSYYKEFDDGFTLYYLEEDCDAPLFLEAFKSKFGQDPKIKERHSNSDSPIRRFKRV